MGLDHPEGDPEVDHPEEDPEEVPSWGGPRRCPSIHRSTTGEHLCVDDGV
jgi:hypothetical protein